MRAFFLFFTAVFHLSATQCWAVGFDIWETGITRQEMISKAQQNNLPLAKDGSFHSSKTFNPTLLTGDATVFYYQTTLLDHAARVRLHLSPRKDNYAQFLYQIDILFSDPRKTRDLSPYLLKLLEDKYGPARTAPDLARSIKVWNPGQDDEVRLIQTPASLQLLYTDLKIKAFAEKLGKSTYGLPQQPANHQDARRF